MFPKDKLDIAVLPQGQTPATSRDGKGLEGLIARLKPLAIEAVAAEATEGSKRSLRRAWQQRGCQSLSSIRRKFAPLPKRLASAPKLIRSMPWSSLVAYRWP